MSIYEYHSYEDEDEDGRNCGRLFDGRWNVKHDHDPDASGSFYYLEWTDLFGHHDKTRLIMPTCGVFVRVLTKNLALLFQQYSFENPQLFWGLRLDWKNLKIQKGESVLERSDRWNEAVIVDRAGPLPNGDICFLLVRNNVNGAGKPFNCVHHCYLDAGDLKIVRDSRPIPLDSDEFNCLDLCGDIISGLSTSLLEIKRYNFRTGKFVDTVLVQGLPPTISCLWYKYDNRVALTPRGAWTSSHLFLWSNEGCEYPDNEEDIDEDFEYDATKISSVYHVDLKTGIASATALNFKGWIKEFVIGPDGNHLYIRVDKFLN